MNRLLLACILLLSTTTLMAAEKDVTTKYVENPDFEARFAGWINNGFYYVTNQNFSKKHGYVYMERWTPSGGKIPTVEICQDLYLPAGTYTLTAGCQNVQQSGKIPECVGARLYANDEGVTVTGSQDYSVTFTVLQGVTKIGFKVSGTNANWASIDNVRLTLLDTDVAAEHAELQKLIDKAVEALGEGKGTGADVLSQTIEDARKLIEGGGNDKIDSLAKQLNDAALNYRILNSTGTAPQITTNPYVAAGATVLLARMTVSASGVLERGFCWSTSPEPTIFDNRSTRYFSSNGEIYRMEKLQPGTMYYVRPYVLTTKYALAYGDILKAPTLPKGKVTADYDNGGSTQENYRIASAIEEIKWLYNNISSVRGINLSVHYGAQTPTADCSYGGWMRVGPNESYQQTGTILHETNHGVGVGTSDVWWNSNYRQDGNRGRWLGPRATQMIQFLNKDNAAYMTGDDTHMWPSSSYSGPNYGINGSWEDSYNPENTLLYYGNVLLTHALHQDGLVCSTEVGFASPAYTFTQDDEAKYYIKTTDKDFGNETSLMGVTESGLLTQKAMSAAGALADDNFAWNIVYNPKTAFYSLRNVGTGRLLTCTGQQFRTVVRTTPASTERVQLLPSRTDFAKGPLKMPSHWITIGRMALRATSKTAVGGIAFDSDDANTKQHWLLLTADEMSAFDQYNAEQALPRLDEVIAAARQSMEVHSEAASAEITLEEAAAPLQELIASVEAAKGTFCVDETEQAIEDIRSAFATYLAKVKPASQQQPIPVSWLILNRSFDQDASGWTKGPDAIKYGVAEFLEATFNTYQNLPQEFPEGNYMLTLSAFQRPGTYQNAYTDWTAGKDAVKAQMYVTVGANTVYETVQNIWDGASDTKKTGQCVGIKNRYIPNNTLAVRSWFWDGYYQNTLSFTLDAPSALRIGIRSPKSDASWWTCFDDFGLLYYGPYEAATAIGSVPCPVPSAQPDAWYDLEGRLLTDRPTRKGLYIHNGRKTVVK